MEGKIRTLLDETIEVKLRNLTQLSTNESVKSREVDELTQLYKLRIEEAKLEVDRLDKAKQRENEQTERLTELGFKSDQLKAQKLDRWVNVGMQVGLALGGWIAYDIWNRRGLKFEETGTITSPMTRNLISRMLPKK